MIEVDGWTDTVGLEKPVWSGAATVCYKYMAHQEQVFKPSSWCPFFLEPAYRGW